MAAHLGRLSPQEVEQLTLLMAQARAGAVAGGRPLSLPDPAARRAVLRDALGIGVAVGAYGISFGAAATTAGLSVLQACALSLLVFTGASQFALVGVLGAGGGALAAVAGAALLGTRNLLYAVRLADLLRLRGGRRAAGRPGDDRRDDRDGDGGAAGPRPAWRSGRPARRCTRCGTSRPCSAPSARASSTPPRSAWTPRSAPRSSACSRRRCATGPALATALGGAAVAALAVPFTPPGVPVLLAGLAVALGLRR